MDETDRVSVNVHPNDFIPCTTADRLPHRLHPKHDLVKVPLPNGDDVEF